MWNHDQAVDTSHPVVDKGTRDEEPVDVHTDQGRTGRRDVDELPHYTRGEETVDHEMNLRPHQMQPRYLTEAVSPATSRGTLDRKATYDPGTALYDREILGGQYGADILPYTRQCQGTEPPLPQYHIPRPSLKCTDSECSCGGSKSPDSSKTWPAGRTSMASSNSSSQSGSSGSLLLTAANLAALRCKPGQVDIAPEDSVSLASSTHFTVVNGVDRRKTKPLPTCCWHRHQLTALVLAMSTIFLIIILAAVLYVEMRWRDIHMFR